MRPTRKWREGDFDRAKDALADLLCGVGRKRNGFEELTEGTLQVRRLVTEEEAIMLGGMAIDIRGSSEEAQRLAAITADLRDRQ